MKFGLRCELEINLLVSFELMGANHEFIFENRNVRISLPSKYHDSHAKEPDLSASDIAKCYKWKSGRPVAVSVNKIFVFVELISTDEIVVDEGWLGVSDSRDANAIFSEHNSQEKFRDAARILSYIATNAFDYWCRTTRWKTNLSYIGLSGPDHADHPGWRYICTAEPHQYFASFNDILYSQRMGEMPDSSWDEIAKSLQINEIPPLWVDLMFDAERRLVVRDYRGALIHAAISTEAYLRSRITEALKPLPVTEKAIIKRIEGWGIGEIIHNINKISTTEQLKLSTPEVNKIKRLIETRNAILHGRRMKVEKDEAESAVNAVKSLFQRS